MTAFIESLLPEKLPTYKDVKITEIEPTGYSEPTLANISDKVIEDETIKYNKLLMKTWFKVGIEFANGEIDNYLELSSREIAEKIRLPKSEKYVLNSYDSSDNYQKNIFNKRHDKALIIIEYCKIKNIHVVDSFYQRAGLERYKN
ncbi:MAG: hypothetical protein GYB35_16150 [Algicola sp.]|nr:hypothetical protein [Algicola sp.]